jgi:mRNA-degrading endonuclease toxin of MazEF toxin-antitoxin module
MKTDRNFFPPAKQREVYKFRTSPKETEGTEIMKSRPGIIISSDELNKWGERYIFLPITSKKFDRVYRFEILIEFQGKKGKALPDQIKTYSHSRIIKKLGVLDPKYYSEIEDKLKEVFSFHKNH